MNNALCMLQRYSKVQYKLQLPLLELYHKVLTFTVSQMNIYCLIIPSAMYFALNTPNFQRVTGFPPPQPSIDTREFARYSNPFLSIYEEPTKDAGDFTTLNSLGQNDGVAEPGLGPHPVSGLTHRASKPGTRSTTEVRFLSPNRPFSVFKSVEDLEAELRT